MSSESGRLVDVKTKFHREATKPGGVSRSGAHMSAARSVSDMQGQVQQQLAASVGPLVALLRAWLDASAAEGCERAALVRDLAGLADMHLLTEVAMHTFDCLDAVLIDGARVTPAEAACFADALVFAQQNRGSDLAPYAELLRDLEALTTLVIERNSGAAIRA